MRTRTHLAHIKIDEKCEVFYQIISYGYGAKRQNRTKHRKLNIELPTFRKKESTRLWIGTLGYIQIRGNMEDSRKLGTL